MPGIDTHIRHYRVNHDTGERTLNTDFNVFLALNAISYVVFLILIFTVGAFGGISSTTQALAYRYQSIMTPDAIFFKIVWAIVIPWHGFWVVWQIVQPAHRNCEGVIRASYFYPFMTFLYAGYTISVRFNAIILGTIFTYGLCGAMVGLIMSMQRWRGKMLPGYMIWQGPHSLLGAWLMIETMLMTNALFVRLGEEWIIKVIIGCLSLAVIFITAIAWLSSYPVDFIVPGVICYAVGGIYLELLDRGHYGNLFRQGYSNSWLTGAKWTVLAVFILILISLFLKILVVLISQRPRDQEERRKRVDPRTSISITIDTGKNNNNNNSNGNNNNNNNNNRKKSRKNRGNNNDYDDYDDYDYDDRGNYDEERPQRSRSQPRRGSNDRQPRRGSNDRQNRRGSGDRRGGGYDGDRRGGHDDYGDHQSPRRSRSKPRTKNPRSPRKNKVDDNS